MRRSSAWLGALACALLGACAGGKRTVAVSAVNLSDTPLRVSATLETGTATQSVGRVDLAPGASGGFGLEIPEGGRDGGAEVRLEPVGGGAPTTVTMSPPGPYLLKIVGVGGKLELERQAPEGARDRGGVQGLPPDPARRTWGGGP